VSDDGKMLSQEEIDALLNQPDSIDPKEQLSDTETESESLTEIDSEDNVEDSETGDSPQRIIESKVKEYEADILSPAEKDALGEIGNISMGTASTTLSELLQQRVSITSPKVRVTTQEELFSAFEVPYMVIQVEFKEGLTGFNILIMQLRDAMVMANLMMGGDGTSLQDEFSEMEISAASEAMNQMIGTASTSLATMFGRSINISPPVTQVLETPDQESFKLPAEGPIVVISFRLTIGELVNSEVMQILSIDAAKDEASLLLQGLYGAEDAKVPVEQQEEDAGSTGQSPMESASAQSMGDEHITEAPPAPGSAGPGRNYPTLDIDNERLAMLMDIPLKATVVLGRTKKTIKEVLTYTPGAIVELASQVEEPVEILVNGVLVARGEVVVVNENFGVKITDILTPAERVAKLTEQL